MSGLRHRFPELVAATTGLTFLLLLLGIYTGASGTGLACGARWPVCGGGPFGLFPPNLASVPEWTHRFVAMLTGFLILGTAGGAWLTDQPLRTRAATAVALVLLPLQVALGALTVTLNGVFPGGFSIPVQIAHLTTATVIFAALVAATVWAWRPARGALVRRATAVAAVTLALSVAFSRGTIFTYTATAKTLYFAFAFALLASLVALVVAGSRALRAFAVATFLLVFAQLWLADALFPYTATVRQAYFALALLSALTLAAAGWLVRRERPGVPSPAAD